MQANYLHVHHMHNIYRLPVILISHIILLLQLPDNDIDITVMVN